VPVPPATAATPAIGGTPQPLDGYAIATTALALQGTPYRTGGTDPSGFDCSGLVQYVLGRYGLAWPRVVRDQFAVGERVKLDDIQPGDLVFFATESREVSHVGIAIGGDRFVHAPNSRGVVRVESLGSEYWSRHFAGARRIY
jgi:cell wall-associated NlpC family hydrolase